MLVVLCLLAGCGAAPPTDGDGGTTVEVRASNEAPSTRIVAFSVVPRGFDGVLVEYENGSARTVAATSLDEVPSRALDGAVSLRVAGRDVRTARYDLPQGTGQGRTFEAVAGNATVVYSVAAPGRADGEVLRSVGVATCGAGVARMTVDVSVRRGDHLDVATTCEG